MRKARFPIAAGMALLGVLMLPAPADAAAPAAGRPARASVAADADALPRALGPDPEAAIAGAMRYYHAVTRAGGWRELPPGPTLRPGDRSAAVPILRQRLISEGDLAPRHGAAEPRRYDQGLAAAVRRYQARHGLAVDGLVGPKTRAALAVPAQARVEQLLINAERRRWMPPQPQGRHVRVNIPAYEVQLREKGRTLLRSRAIVGRPSRPTPVFHTEITHLVLNPSWTVPERIARQDLLPELRRDPSTLEARGFRVLSGWGENARALDPHRIDWQSIEGRFPYVLRQAPGPTNALGSVKFHMPNPFSVYLHDTPARGLFQRMRRSFSSGCVRVEESNALARALLGEDRHAQLARLAAGHRTRYLKLATPVPVQLVYFTAWVEADGSVHFRDDIYGRDERLRAGLRQADAGGYRPGPEAGVPWRPGQGAG